MLTDADSRTDTNFKSLRDLSRKEKKYGAVDASTRRLHAWAMDALHPPPFLGLHACNKMDAWPMDAPLSFYTQEPILLHAKKIAWEGDRHQTSNNIKQTDIATTRSNRPSGPIDENSYYTMIGTFKMRKTEATF